MTEPCSLPPRKLNLGGDHTWNGFTQRDAFPRVEVSAFLIWAIGLARQESPSSHSSVCFLGGTTS